MLIFLPFSCDKLKISLGISKWGGKIALMRSLTLLLLSLYMHALTCTCILAYSYTHSVYNCTTYTHTHTCMHDTHIFIQDVFLCKQYTSIYHKLDLLCTLSCSPFVFNYQYLNNDILDILH